MSLPAAHRLSDVTTTYVLLPGASSDGWYWHLVAPRLRALGHEVLTPDLPLDDDSAGLPEYADTVVEAIGGRSGVILVAQSMAGFTAPIVVTRVPIRLIVLVAAMVPVPGESAGEWWANTGQPQAKAAYDAAEGRPVGGEFDPLVTFLHDVPTDVAAESAAHVVRQSGTPFEAPWPLDRWPDVPTRFLLLRGDRLFPAQFQRRLVRDRLGITPDEMDGGHLPALHSPDELVRRLVGYEAELETSPV